jgi:hypothetical protein
MFALIVLIIFGLGMAYFATQNTGVVHILIGSYLITGIPIYVIAIGAILLGVFISWLISMIDSFSSSMILHGKDSALKEARKNIDKLQEENRELTIEIANLKGQKGVREEVEEEKKEQESVLPRPSLFPHFRHNVA